MTVTTARWLPWQGDGLEHLVLTEDADGITADAMLIANEDNGRVGVSYRVQCDRAWHVRRAHISIVGEDRELDLVSDGAGRWSDGKGRALAQLQGAIDIDLTVTPFTNTLPIRRLGLRAGAKAEIDVAYVTFPALALTRERQIYTCIAPFDISPLGRYRFETGDGTFMREIEVDAAGLVLNYPDLFTRVF